MRPTCAGTILTAIVVFLQLATPSEAQLIINEVHYNVAGAPGGNQYIELLNTATTNVFLDGLIISDEGDTGAGLEGIFQFPGTGTNFPVAPGAYVVIAVDATNATAGADWECYAPGAFPSGDTDNPAVSNITLVSGSFDLDLSKTGDNVFLADGTDTTAPIDPATVMDGVNFASGDGELAPIGRSIPESDGNVTSAVNRAVSRCPNGLDTDSSSATDFSEDELSMGNANNCELSPEIVLLDFSGTLGNIQITWSSVSGAMYRVEYTTNFNATPQIWTGISGDITATSVTSTKNDSDAALTRDYRILQTFP